MSHSNDFNCFRWAIPVIATWRHKGYPYARRNPRTYKVRCFLCATVHFLEGLEEWWNAAYICREQWTRQVRRTHAGWSGPTATSYLCSDHFTEDCFDESSLMAAKLGIQKRKTLKPDAVPTVFPKTVQQKAAPPPSKKRAASCSTEPDSQISKKEVVKET